MARFNLEDYETVEERLKRFYADHPDGRVITFEVTGEEDRAKGYWVVRAELYLNHEELHARTPKAHGYAFEIEGTAGANVTSSLENAETSAIGRALANANYSGNKRASREEMEKVARGPAQAAAKPAPDEFLIAVDASVSVEELEALWNDSVKAGFSDSVKTIVAKKKRELNND